MQACLHSLPTCPLRGRSLTHRAYRPCKRLVCKASSSQKDPKASQQSNWSQSLSSVEQHAVLVGDTDKERSRKFRRVTFDHDGWAKHRSTGRYWRHIRSMTRSRIVKGLAGPLAYVGIVATMVCCYEALLEQQMLPDLGFQWPGLAVATTGVYSLSTFALSLLLVFRTNSSYQRWNDARKLWGLTTNRCRDLGRQVTQWMTDPADAELAAGACRMIKAFPIALMDSLRSDHDLKTDLAAVLQPQELQVILQQPHIGTAVLQALGAFVSASKAKEVQKLRMDENITVLQDTMGGCERIFRTPIPLVYTRHTSRFLLCWLTILPFCTAGQVGWLTVPIACGMAFFLLGIEEIGVQVEEPFGILALELFCENIMKNVQQAETAAAAMHGIAQGHTAATATWPAGSYDTSGSTGKAGMATAITATSSGSSGSKSLAALRLQPPPQVLVAGQEVLAAEEAHGTGVQVALTQASMQAAANSPKPLSSSGGSSSEAGSVPVQASALLASCPTAPLSGASFGSMGSRDSEAADSTGQCADASDLAAYWQSSVSSGALAGDSEDSPF